MYTSYLLISMPQTVHTTQELVNMLQTPCILYDLLTNMHANTMYTTWLIINKLHIYPITARHAPHIVYIYMTPHWHAPGTVCVTERESNEHQKGH